MDSERKVNSDPRRRLPSVDRLIRDVRGMDSEIPEWAIARTSRELVAAARREMSLTDPSDPPGSMTREQLGVAVLAGARRLVAPHPRRVLNATGVLLHTNLGRAPLASQAAEAIGQALEGYSNLELDLETGRRGSRMGSLEAKLLALSGAEAAHVVNNNAAAVLLALNTLALGQQAIVSRGELVEIGGSFRVPAIMERAGVQLMEVGTTNRTHLADYEQAIGPETGLLLKVHRSNFEQRGFVAEADVRALALLARERKVPLVEDLGSGTLLDLGEYGLPEEAYVPARLALGVDLVCFSGDKLLGGPQAGILLGRRSLVDALRKNPLARALRVDKLTLAALDATLDLMLEGRSHEIPTVAGLRADASELAPRAARLREIVSRVLASAAPNGPEARIEPSEVAVGGGSIPEHRLAGWAIRIDGVDASRTAERLRAAPTPVLARVRADALWLEVRTLREEDLEEVGAALAFALAEPV